MKTNLLESYKGRLAVSESYFAKSHNGEKLSQNKKLVVAKLLENTNKFLNEAFDNSVGTQRSDMGLFRKFALNLTTVAVPNLIAFDLVLVHPMSSMAGYINYIEYTAGSNKGGVKQGEVFNSPFGLGKVDPNYTASVVAVDGTFAATDPALKITWTPVVAGTVDVTVGTTRYVDNGAGAFITVPAGGSVIRRANMVEKVDGRLEGVQGVATVQVLDQTGAAVTATTGTINYETGETTGIAAASAAYNLKYSYNNVVIPQNDLPIVNAEMKAIPLVAKARRIAIYYSQIAAFQAKNDYGFDLGDQLAEKAVGQLSYEIDTEVTQMLIDNAASDSDLVWSKTLPVGVSKQEHYAGFVEILEIARQKIYDRTKRFAPNYMLISSNILPILAFIPGFEAAPAGSINGPYFAGTLNSLKVYVTPNITPNTFVIGVNGDDMMSSAAVYAPYMPVVPTQLLGYADGAMSQGWSTMYDLKLLNANLLVSGRITA